MLFDQRLLTRHVPLAEEIGSIDSSAKTRLSLFPNWYGAPCNDFSAENCTAVQPADCNFTIAASNDLHAWQGSDSEVFCNTKVGEGARSFQSWSLLTLQDTRSLRKIHAQSPRRVFSRSSRHLHCGMFPETFLVKMSIGDCTSAMILLRSTHQNSRASSEPQAPGVPLLPRW